MFSRHLLALGLAAATISPAAAQDTTLPACETQQEMEQVIQTDGDLMPDGCRTLTITRMEADVDELCVLDFEATDPGVLDALQEAAMPSQWWVECAELTGW